MGEPPICGELRAAPNIEHCRILAPADRVPECVVPIAVRDRSAGTIAALYEALDGCRLYFEARKEAGVSCHAMLKIIDEALSLALGESPNA